MGCSHVDVKGSDLVRDEILKRLIGSHEKQRWSTQDMWAGYATATKKIKFVIKGLVR